jgi:hypothetical protein
MFVPEPGHTKSILAVSALARAMDASHQVALVRCVWRQGQNNVVLGVLTPYVATQLNRVRLHNIIWRFLEISARSVLFCPTIF